MRLGLAPICATILSLAAACGGYAPPAGQVTNNSGPYGNGSALLTIKNFESWCSLTAAGNPASSNAVQLVMVNPGTITLDATALPGFELGPAPWHQTDGDTGSGDPGMVSGTGQSASSSTTVKVGDGGACVSVCCPFSPSGTGCPTTNQCP
jgi:hypothetical protein